MPPSITWAHQGADGGDLITAAYTLGVPHPSGYPTYVLAGWLLSHLPLGSIAWRVGLLSALSMAGAAWFIFAILRRLLDDQGAALAAAWAFAATPLVWSQAIIAEVYGLHLFFAAGLLWWALKDRLATRPRLVGLGSMAGLGLGVHLTLAGLFPLLLGLLWRHRSAFWLKLLPGGLLGLSVYVYLPWRAGEGAITWGKPDSAAGFLSLVSGEIYRGYLFSLPPDRLWPRLLGLLNYVSEMGLLAVILLGLGLYWAWHNARLALLGGVTTVLGYAVYALGYRTSDSYVYLLPIFLLAAIGIGFGAHEVLSQGRSPATRRLLSALILIGILAGGSWHSRDLSLRHDQTAERFRQTILAQAPPQGVLLTYQDNHTFTLWYAHYVLGQRPDLSIVDTGLLAFDWYQAQVRADLPVSAGVATLADHFQHSLPYPVSLCAVLADEADQNWHLACLVTE